MSICTRCGWAKCGCPEVIVVPGADHDHELIDGECWICGDRIR